MDLKNVEGIVVKKNIDGKRMTLIEIDHHQYPYGTYNRAKRDYKISNIKYFRLNEGDLVVGELFKHPTQKDIPNAFRFHIKQQLNRNSM